jgi:hypothetical protein
MAAAFRPKLFPHERFELVYWFYQSCYDVIVPCFDSAYALQIAHLPFFEDVLESFVNLLRRSSHFP